MTEILRHRGNDGADYFFHENVFFGFNRLSIIDIKHGNQPMTSMDGRYIIVFNGEIYNYIELRRDLESKGVTFTTDSDTEVLLNMYVTLKEECLDFLNGMFSFAIWDCSENRLFVARDRLGIKPFYYYYDGDKFVFASEIKAIIADPSIPRIPNHHAILDYLNFMYVPDDKTFFQGIHKLQPGYCGWVSEADGLKLKEYWDVKFTHSSLSESDYVDGLRNTLNDAVRIHLRSDVPVGCHLSGGLDSSTVTSLAARHYQGQLKTFSGKFAEESFYDETPYAKLVSERCGTEYLEVIPNSDYFKNEIHRILWHMDEPVVGPGVVPQSAVCRLASGHVKVVLGGQGGDELFGGYPRYFLNGNSGNQALKLKWSFLKSYLQQHGLKTTAGKVMKRLAKQQVARTMTFEQMWLNQISSIDVLRPTLMDSFLQGLDNYKQEDIFLSYIRKGVSDDPIDLMLYHDIKTYLPGLLHVEDRTSMAVSLESRVPLLDYRVVEMVATIPSVIKVKNADPKYILKQAMAGIIPEEIRSRKDKKGFPTPIQHWIRSAPEFFESILLDASARDRGLFKLDMVRNLIRSNQDRSRLLWRILNVELWFKIFIDQDSRFVDHQGRPLEKVVLL